MVVQTASLPEGLGYQQATSLSSLPAVGTQHVGLEGQEPAASPSSPALSGYCGLAPTLREADVCVLSLFHRALQQPGGLSFRSSGVASSMSC